MQFKLIEKKPVTQGVESFIFAAPERIQWQAGQYLHYNLPHENPDDRGTERWFTISSAPFEQNPTITTRFSPEKGSSFKRTLENLNVGSTIEASGVEGKFVVNDPTQHYVFIAGGIGITPFHSILKQADHDGVLLNVDLLYANRDQNIPFKEEFDTYASRNRNLRIHYVINPDKIDEQKIRETVSDLSTPLFYVSGPEPMVKAMKQMLLGMNIPKEHIKRDDFPGYEQF